MEDARRAERRAHAAAARQADAKRQMALTEHEQAVRLLETDGQRLTSQLRSVCGCGCGGGCVCFFLCFLLNG